MARMNVSVPDEQKEWLDEHPEINVSGLLQSAVRQRMEQEGDAQ